MASNSWGDKNHFRGKKSSTCNLVWNGEEHIGRQDLTCVSKKHSKGEQNRTGIIWLQNYSGLLF